MEGGNRRNSQLKMLIISISYITAMPIRERAITRHIKWFESDMRYEAIRDILPGGQKGVIQAVKDNKKLSVEAVYQFTRILLI
jgi:hypothetical protein